MKPIRVLHCPELVGGNAQQLARAERELGLESVAVAFEQTVFAYETDEVLFAPSDRLLRREAKRVALLRRALRDFDVVHFNFGRTLTPVPPDEPPVSRRARLYAAYARIVELRDLPLLKRAGKAVVVTYQGDDARQGDYSRAHLEVSIASHGEPGYYTPSGDEHRRRRIRVVDRHADAIFALNPDLLRVLPARAEFLPYASVDIASWTPLPLPAGPPVVLHAPTNRGGKGTRFVLDAVERLREEGVEFDFELVEGVSRAEARRSYERSHLLVDQLFAGWYGGVAVELMALGRPVVAHVRESDLERVPAELRAELPVVDARPGTITDVLRRCLAGDLADLGARSRAFVERWHDPLLVAARTRDTYRRILRR